MTRRRLLFGLIAAVILLGVGARWFFRHHRPALSAGQRYGLDVSHHQGEIDWSAVADDDIGFVYIKATEGGDWVDPRFTENWEAARREGLGVSAYHFFTECRSGEEQAANFLETVPLAEADMPLALDLEFAVECSDPMTPPELRAAVATFIAEVEAKAGSELLIYLLPDFDEKYELAGEIDRNRWSRSLYHRPNTEWAVWQYSATAYIEGIDGGVDLNVGTGG